VSEHTGGAPETDMAVEFVWDQLWPQLALREGFWLGYLFCSNLNTVNVLVARADDYARMRVKETQARSVGDPADLPGILDWLLSDHDPHVGLTWVIGIAGDPPPWRPAWARFLRRLNERRDALTGRMPGGLVLCLTEGLLLTARDSAPDLWSYRSMVVEANRASSRPLAPTPPPVLPPLALAPRRMRPRPGAVAERALLPATEPSEALRAVLRSLAAALQAGDIDAAVAEARMALAAAGATGASADLALAHAWTARALREKEDLAGAIDHTRRALNSEAPLGTALTGELLEILASSPDLDTVQAVRETHLALARSVRDRDPDSPDALRGLSVSLDKVADIEEQRGQLDDALTNYTESLNLARQLLAHYGDTPQTLRDLSVSLNNVANIHRQRGQLDDALTNYTESLNLARRILTHYGDTPQTLRDLSVSLDKVADIHRQRGQLDDALTNYTESLDVYRQLMEKYGPPLADPDELASISANLDRVALELARAAEPHGGPE
jgi:tetratricopeptide (TPR) repeat protein